METIVNSSEDVKIRILGSPEDERRTGQETSRNDSTFLVIYIKSPTSSGVKMLTPLPALLQNRNSLIAASRPWSTASAWERDPQVSQHSAVQFPELM